MMAQKPLRQTMLSSRVKNLPRRHFTVVLAFVLVGLFWSQLYRAFAWNLANVLLTHARMTSSSEEMYRDSQRTIQLLSRFDTEPGVTSRLAQANHLLWRAASALGFSELGIESYARIQGTNGDSNSPPACPGGMPRRLEAGTFSNVTADGMARPRKIGRSPGTGVILFTTEPPISHAVCVPAAGIYTVAVAAVEGKPPPIEIDVEWNGWYVGTLEYAQGNDMLSTKQLRVAVPPGNHLLSLRYSNDFADRATGIDRNALIDHVEISGP
ncbi:MAG: hypothetical protein IT328_08225 [Caldilineaceae bacterium]|nr:hypothetical protein [Caldilineaceae bacterium]